MAESCVSPSAPSRAKLEKLGGEGWRGFHNEYDNDTPYIECPLHGSGAWIDEGFDGSDTEFDNAGDGFIDNWIDGDG